MIENVLMIMVIGTSIVGIICAMALLFDIWRKER